MPKRGYPSNSAAFAARKKAKSSVPSGATYKKRRITRKKSKFAKAVMSVVNRKAETKLVFRELAVNEPVRNNNILSVTNNAFECDLGTGGEVGNPGSTSGIRVGKSIYLKGLKIAINLEALQKRAQTTYWLYLVRNKTSPATTITGKADMFEGRSAAIPMDYLDTDKCHVLFCKKIILRMPNAATSADMPSNNDNTGSGFAPTWVNAGNPEQKFVVTNPQKIAKFYVRLNRKVTFQDSDQGTTLRKVPMAGQQYQWVLIGYDNYATTTNTSNSDSQIASLHMTQVMYFTDVV